MSVQQDICVSVLFCLSIECLQEYQQSPRCTAHHQCRNCSLINWINVIRCPYWCVHYFLVVYCLAPSLANKPDTYQEIRLIRTIRLVARHRLLIATIMLPVWPCWLLTTRIISIRPNSPVNLGFGILFFESLLLIDSKKYPFNLIDSMSIEDIIVVFAYLTCSSVCCSLESCYFQTGNNLTILFCCCRTVLNGYFWFNRETAHGKFQVQFGSVQFGGLHTAQVQYHIWVSVHTIRLSLQACKCCTVCLAGWVLNLLCLAP